MLENARLRLCSKKEEVEKMPRIKNPYTGGTITVSSVVRVGAKGSARQRSYCARSGRIAGSWKRNPNSKNLVQRRRWKCPYVPGELRVSEYKRRS